MRSARRGNHHPIREDLLGVSYAFLAFDHQDRGIWPGSELVEIKKRPGCRYAPCLPPFSGGAADVTVRAVRFAVGIVEAGDGERFVAVSVAIPPQAARFASPL